MRGAQRDGARYRCAVSYAGVSDLSAMMRYDSRFLNHGGRKDWLKEQAPDFAAVSPIHFAAHFSTPILLMHGRKDRRVQVHQSRVVAAQLQGAGTADGRHHTLSHHPPAAPYFPPQAPRPDGRP